jgi:hypothetical protein
VIVQGLSAYLLGICYEYNDESQESFNRASLQSLIITRMGADIFVGRMERLRESRHFQKAANYFIGGEEDVYFDYAFVEMFKSSAGITLNIYYRCDNQVCGHCCVEKITKESGDCREKSIGSFFCCY